MRRARLLAAVLALAALVGALGASRPLAVSPNVVVSQVYGGGGNSGATYTHDFVELFNLGSTSTDLTGWSVQYASATGTGNFAATALPAVTLAPGQHLLVQEAQGTGGTTPLPTPDAAGTIAMSATGGKVIVASTATALACNGGSTPCSAAQLAQIVDLVGYGTANFFEGTAAAPAPSNTTAVLRAAQGCTDTDDNAANFSTGTPTPRNTASPATPCTSDAAPSVASTTPANGATNVASAANLTITFSEAVNVSGSWFDITCATSGAHTAVVSGGPTTFTLNPAADFAAGESCAITVFASLVADQDTDDPPDQMAANHVFGFGVTALP